MQLQQIHPNPGLDPGFRLDLDGRARFRYEGYDVDVQVRRATAEPEDVPYCDSSEPSRYDLVVTGTVRLEGVVVGESASGADERDPYVMRAALDEVLRDAVQDTRRTAARIAAHVADIDRKHREVRT